MYNLAQIFSNSIPFFGLAGVMELVDVADSKSAGGDSVWVRVPPPAPSSETLDTSVFEASGVFFFVNKKCDFSVLVLSVFSPVLSKFSRAYTFTLMPGLMLTTLVILVAEVLLDAVSR